MVIPAAPDLLQPRGNVDRGRFSSRHVPVSASVTTSVIQLFGASCLRDSRLPLRPLSSSFNDSRPGFQP